MGKVLILYATQTGNTRDIAHLIAEGCRFAGCEATVKTIKDISDPSELEQYDALFLGSATYNSNMMEDMAQFLEIAYAANLSGKPGGAFGAYGWSGEAPDLIHSIMKDKFNMRMAGDSLRLKSAQLAGGMKMAQDYGRALASKIAG